MSHLFPSRTVRLFAFLTILVLAWLYFPRDHSDGIRLNLLHEADGFHRGFQVRFDVPIAPEEIVGTTGVAGPIQIRPELPGTWKWLDIRTAEFIPDSFPGYERNYQCTLKPRHNWPKNYHRPDA